MIEKSPEITELAKALNEFQASVKGVTKDGTNPFFKSKYATLENTIDTIRGSLAKVGLSFTQFPEGENLLVTILMHNSGQYLMGSAQMSPKESTPQAQGSAITYMRRYALSAVLGLATEEDDDGNEATKPQSKTDVASEANRLITNATSLANLTALTERIKKSTKFTKAQKDALVLKATEKASTFEKKDENKTA